MEQKSYYKTVNLALDILECFGPHHESMSVSNIASELGINKSSASKMLSTLAARSFVTKSEVDGKYSIGIKILALSSLVKTELREIAEPYMKKISKETRETVSLFVREKCERRCLYQVEGNQEITLRMSVGARYPLHIGAPSKVLLAYLSKQKRTEILDQCITKRDEVNPKYNRASIEAEMETVRKQGFAVSLGDRSPHIGSISAPIRDRTKEVIAAICVVAPTLRINATKIEQFSKLLIIAANTISTQLGYPAE
jgi:IclR family transcriptional regulator, KDG regulon repressor